MIKIYNDSSYKLEIRDTESQKMKILNLTAFPWFGLKISQTMVDDIEDVSDYGGIIYNSPNNIIFDRMSLSPFIIKGDSVEYDKTIFFVCIKSTDLILKNIHYENSFILKCALGIEADDGEKYDLFIFSLNHRSRRIKIRYFSPHTNNTWLMTIDHDDIRWDETRVSSNDKSTQPPTINVFRPKKSTYNLIVDQNSNMDEVIKNINVIKINKDFDTQVSNLHEDGVRAITIYEKGVDDLDGKINTLTKYMDIVHILETDGSIRRIKLHVN